ncbi:hypothetical protein NQ318_021314 [Aromia moschata]|uniref:Reverse transcriptase n=1 Tax=Aromia moschata TaxID=1265417 RepID=A0AAV8ZEE4_9CUCU|nr:hypothetical protein NQ318_021314 [Aromia moschata]
MPNIGGPSASKRKLLASVVHSQILYVAPVWHRVTQNKKLIRKLARIQRRVSIRICSAYKTISTEGVGVIAGIPPIDLMIQERVETYDIEQRNTAKTTLMARWQEKWTNGTYRRWTWRLIDYYIDSRLFSH